MKNITLLLIGLSLFFSKANAFTLSKDATISILTCSQGAELYSLFGHTAIRVQDPVSKIDEVFNYGTFDFNTPNFYMKYMKGLLPYYLTTTSFKQFINTYIRDNRTVYSQTLKLDSIQKQQVFGLLLENLKPENCSYLYNFLYDNCTTRARDIILKSIKDNVEWNIADVDYSFWNLLDECLQISPWSQWGIHTILGQSGNQEATTFQYMFLPDHLMFGLNTAQLNNVRLAEETEVLYRASKQDSTTPWYLHPIFIFSLVCNSLILLFNKVKNILILNTVSFILFLTTGIIGCLIVFLGAFTAHPMTAPNWNILLANPFNLIASVFLFRKSIPNFIRVYLKIYMGILIFAIPTWFILQPAVPMLSIFIIILMIYVSMQRYKR